MWKSLVAVVLCVPVVANAGLIFVNYEGSVSAIDHSCDSCPTSYSVGQHISGSLFINPAIAPPAERPVNPPLTMADYIGVGVDFISGRPHATNGTVNDAVFVQDNLPLPEGHPHAGSTYDYLMVADGVIPTGGVVGSVRDILKIEATRYSPSGQMIHGDGLAQEFDVTPDEGTTLIGRIFQKVGRFSQDVTLSFSHLSMGVCPR